ncbi:MAG: cytochrome c3 family protein [Nitrospirota bacterium]
MRKTIIIGFVVMLSLVLVYGFSDAKVTGVCSNCHTMHLSQGGTTDTFEGVTVAGPINALIKATSATNPCVACHAGAAGATDSATGAPQVDGTNGLAGGTFNTTTADTPAKVHNVSVLRTADSTFTATTLSPPGFTASAPLPPAGLTTGPSTWTISTNQLTCAGTYGCHGKRDTTNPIKAIQGAHHGNTNIDNTSTAGTVATSYRFLYGIKGAEVAGWQETDNAHNGYYGTDTQGESYQTISYLCSECHGNFHWHIALGGTTEVGGTSPWLRHPTDIALAASTGGIFTTDYGTLGFAYNLETPVAFESPVTTTTTFTTADARVMCLSCHRAHGSAYTDILRFNYADIKAGQAITTGCNRCHQRQR